MKEVERQKIWEKYTKNPTQEMREQIIIEYAPLVKIVAGRLSMYLGGNVEYEDLVSYGVFGLIDAIDKFDTNKDVKFETYASLRIRGSILDQIRKMDWIPRTVRQRQRKIDEAIKSLEARTGKTPTDEMLAEELGVSGEELLSWQSQLKVIAETELKRMLKDAMQLLTEKEQKVILLYYYEDLTLKEISRVLEVSESRISQLHTKALQKMKKKMGPYMNILTD